MSIIDYLQKYNWAKKFEYNWKVKILQYGKDIISSISSPQYAKRFYDFMRIEVIIDEKENLDERNRFSVSSTIKGSRDSMLKSGGSFYKRVTAEK